MFQFVLYFLGSATLRNLRLIEVSVRFLQLAVFHVSKQSFLDKLRAVRGCVWSEFTLTCGLYSSAMMDRLALYWEKRFTVLHFSG